MKLAIFDLDNTLLGGDSDYLWSQFLVEKDLVDGPYYRAENDRFYQQYLNGTMDIFEFLRFQLKPLADNDINTLHQWRAQFIQEKIVPIMLPKAQTLIQDHQAQGHTLLIITATNRFITAPIAEMLSINNLLATDPEMKAGQYTGEVEGTPCYQAGKIERLTQWRSQHGHEVETSWFYSDSRNDIPLLEKVDHPVAVDADDKLTQHANHKGWPVISLR